MPTVVIAVADPVASGLVASLARPAGNVTGLSALSPELTGRMVFISGGAFTPQASRYLAELPNLRIVKPLDPVVIEKVVLALMAGRERPE